MEKTCHFDEYYSCLNDNYFYTFIVEVLWVKSLFFITIPCFELLMEFNNLPKNFILRLFLSTRATYS